MSEQDGGSVVEKPKPKPVREEKKKKDDDGMEEKVQGIVTETYKYAMQFQNVGNYEQAYVHYRALIPIISTEPMVWIRMAECILALLRKPVRFAPPFVYLNSGHSLDGVEAMAVLPRLFHKLPTYLPEIILTGEEGDTDKPKDCVDRKFDPEEMTLVYADMCMVTSRCLMKDSPDVLLRKFAAATHAYIKMKRKNYRKALQLCEDVLIMPAKFDRSTVPQYLIHYSQTLIVECNIRRGRFRRALQLLDRMPEFHFNEYGNAYPSHFRLYNRASTLCGQRKYKEARKAYEKLMKTSFSRKVFALGLHIYASSNHYHEFEDIVTKIVNVVRANPSALPDKNDSSEDDMEKVDQRCRKFKSVRFEHPVFLPSDREYQPTDEARKAIVEKEDLLYQDFWTQRGDAEEFLRKEGTLRKKRARLPIS